MPVPTTAVLRARPDKHAHELEPGEWRGWAAKLPCGHLVTFYRHFVEKGGHVLPSVVCPRHGCDGHFDVVLLGDDAALEV